jgi:hypothetical protein
MDQTHIDSFIPEKVANAALNKLSSYMNLARTVYRDFEAEVADNGDVVRVPKFGNMVANDLGSNGEVTEQTPSDDEVSITLNQNWETTFIIKDVAKAMAKPKVMEGYVENGMIALAEKIENKLALLYSSAGHFVSGGAAWQKDDIRAARLKLINQANPLPKLSPRYLYLNPEAIDDLLAQLDDAAAAGSAKPQVEGSVARLYGFDIFESQNVVGAGSPTTYHGLAYGPQAMALVMRPLPMAPAGLGVQQTVVSDPESGVGIRVTYSYDTKKMGVKVTLDVLFGVGILRANHLVDCRNT